MKYAQHHQGRRGHAGEEVVRFRALAGLALVLAAMCAAGPAQAHSYLLSSTPEEGSTLTELPSEFSVTAYDAMLDLSGDGSGFAIQVQDAAGGYYGDGCLSIVDATLSTGATLGEAGDYTLVWQFVSADGHPVSGEFGFTWAPPAGTEVSAASATPPGCGGTPSGITTNPPPAEEGRQNANLSDVLWIGGVIGVVLVAALVTLFVLGRRRKA